MANFTSIRQETSTPKQERNTWQLSARLTWALGLSVRPSAKLVAVAIVQFAGSTTGLAWPSLATIAATTGLSRRQVVYAIHALEDGEHLAVQRLKVGKKNASNRYRLPRMGGAQAALVGATCAPPPSAQAAPEPGSTLEPVKEPKKRTPKPPKGGLMDSPALVKPRRQKKAEHQYRAWWAETHSTPLPENTSNWPRPEFTGDEPFIIEDWFKAATAPPTTRRRTRSTDGLTLRIDAERRERLLAERVGRFT